jgi:hypothetical protein
VEESVDDLVRGAFRLANQADPPGETDEQGEYAYWITHIQDGIRRLQEAGTIPEHFRLVYALQVHLQYFIQSAKSEIDPDCTSFAYRAACLALGQKHAFEEIAKATCAQKRFQALNCGRTPTAAESLPAEISDYFHQNPGKFLELLVQFASDNQNQGTLSYFVRRMFPAKAYALQPKQ